MDKNKLLLIQKISVIKNNAGFSIVELVVSSSVLAILMVSLVGVYSFLNNSSMAAGLKTRALFLAQEGLEAARNLRDENFLNLVAGNYGLSRSGNQWSLVASPDLTENYSRQINIIDVDQQTKKIETTVSWPRGTVSSSLSLSTYLTNWKRTGLGDWSNIFLESGLSLGGNQAGFDVFVLDNYVYVTRQSGTPNFFVIDVADLNNPQIVGSRTLSANPSAVYVAGNYAYIASSDNNSELQVVDVSTKNAPQLIGGYNAPGSGDATDIFVVDGVAYFTRNFSNISNQNEFYMINVLNPGNPALFSGLNLESTATKLYVNGNYAYIGSSDDNREFQIINITNKAAPVRISMINLTGVNNVSAIEFNSNRIYLGRDNGNVYPIDVSNPLLPNSLLPTGFSVNGGNPLSLALLTNNNYLAVGTNDNTNELKIFDIANIANPSLLSTLNVPGTTAFSINGLVYSGLLDRLFAVGPLVSGNNNYQFIIIKPQ